MLREWLGEIGGGTSKAVLFEIVNGAGEPTQPNTLLMTLYDDVSKQLLGGRPAMQNILNANGGTVTDGAGSLELTPADNELVTDCDTEDHVAFLHWTYTSPGGVVRTERKELVYRVVRFMAPAPTP